MAVRSALVLTLGRIFICPIFLAVYLFYSKMGISFLAMPYVLLFLLILCELSDILDGIFARRSNQVTELGKILDPMADSVVRLSMLLCLTHGIVQLPLLLVFVFVVRDAVISTLRILCALRGKALAARFSGKLKAVLQGISLFFIVILLIPYTMGYLSIEALQQYSMWIVALTAAYTLCSGIEYIWAYRSYVTQAWTAAPQKN